MSDGTNNNSDGSGNGNANDSGNAGSVGNSNGVGTSAVDGSANSANGGNNRSGDGKTSFDNSSTDGNAGNSNGLSITDFAEVGTTGRENRVGSSFADNRRTGKRGRPTGSGKSSGNESSTERFATSGNSSDNGSEAEREKPVSQIPSNLKPKVGGFEKVAVDKTPTGKFKKGYRPLMDEKESIQTIGGLFAMTSLALGSHWELSDNEEKELGKAVSRVLEKFPVKIGENPELLEKIFAIQGLVVVGAMVVIPRLNQSAKGENDGILKQITGRERKPTKEQQPTATATAESNGNATPTNGANFAQSVDEYSDAFRPEL